MGGDGCAYRPNSILVMAYKHKMVIVEEKPVGAVDGEERVKIFLDLLNDGWEIISATGVARAVVYILRK